MFAIMPLSHNHDLSGFPQQNNASIDLLISALCQIDPENFWFIYVVFFAYKGFQTG
jgi:hypothetical protein